jgi:hypothetical protein
MIVRLASEQDAAGFIVLAGQVEHWFGPMVDDPGFRAAIDKHIHRATALVAVASFRRGQLGARLARQSLSLDVGVSTDISAEIRHAVILHDQVGRAARWPMKRLTGRISPSAPAAPGFRR